VPHDAGRLQREGQIPERAAGDGTREGRWPEVELIAGPGHAIFVPAARDRDRGHLESDVDQAAFSDAGEVNEPMNPQGRATAGTRCETGGGRVSHTSVRTAAEPKSWDRMGRRTRPWESKWTETDGRC
jgi:hypothetical protein